MKLSSEPGPIGVFDSGYGGLTILGEIRNRLPQYDYMYLGDNARAPYGSHSFEVVYRYTLQAVETLFERGCQMVILACNTASAKALRTIQQNDLARLDPSRRVLGVIRPTVEIVGSLTTTKHVGILATEGTIRSQSYRMELEKLEPDVKVTGMACPMWVPLVENYEYDSPGADYFVNKRIKGILELDPEIDVLILGCTHYPLLLNKIRQFTPKGITLVPQGKYVAASLEDYFGRHPEMEHKCTKGGTCRYFTTEEADRFGESASLFLKERVEAERIKLVEE